MASASLGWQREEARRLHSVDRCLWMPDEDFLLAQLRREVTRARRYGREVGIAVLWTIPRAWPF